MLQALRLAEPGRALTYEDLHLRLGEPVSAVPAAAGRALTMPAGGSRASAARRARARRALRAAFPALARGEAAEGARDGDAFTEYDGWVPEAGPGLDPARGGQAVSATGLERLAGCPFRHFLQRGLGVRRSRTPSGAGRWLDPLTRGSVLHALYAAHPARAARARRARRPARHGARLRALGEARARGAPAR